MADFYQHRARKRFGQNFLHDAGVIDRILRAIHPNADGWLPFSANQQDMAVLMQCDNAKVTVS